MDAGEKPPLNATGPSGAPLLWGLGLLMGATAMYLLDAENGERRRMRVAHYVEQYRVDVEQALERTCDDAVRQVRGTVQETLRRMRESLLSDEDIEREIYTRMEDVLPFEEAARIHVAVTHGHVRLEGSISSAALNRLLGRVATVPGVRGLDNRLTVIPTGVV